MIVYHLLLVEGEEALEDRFVLDAPLMQKDVVLEANFQPPIRAETVAAGLGQKNRYRHCRIPRPKPRRSRLPSKRLLTNW